MIRKLRNIAIKDAKSKTVQREFEAWKHARRQQDGREHADDMQQPVRHCS